MHQVRVVSEFGATFVQLATSFDEHPIGASHQNVSDFIVGEHRLKWAEPKDVIEYTLNQLGSQFIADRRSGLADEFLNASSALCNELLAVQFACSYEVKGCKQALVQFAPQCGRFDVCRSR